MTYKALLSIAATAVLFLSYQTTTYSGVYKWVDDKGQTHYSDQPDKADAETFNLRDNTTTKSRIIENNHKNSDHSVNDKTDTPLKNPADSQAAESEMVEIEFSKKEKRKLCSEAKNDLTAILSRGRMREINAKGEYTYLAEEQRQQRISAANKKQHEYCS